MSFDLLIKAIDVDIKNSINKGRFKTEIAEIYLHDGKINRHSAVKSLIDGYLGNYLETKKACKYFEKRGFSILLYKSHDCIYKLDKVSVYLTWNKETK